MWMEWGLVFVRQNLQSDIDVTVQIHSLPVTILIHQLTQRNNLKLLNGIECLLSVMYCIICIMQCIIWDYLYFFTEKSLIE